MTFAREYFAIIVLTIAYYIIFDAKLYFCMFCIYFYVKKYMCDVIFVNGAQ